VPRVGTLAAETLT